MESLYVFRLGNRNDSICQNWKTGASFPVFPFSSSHSGCKNWKSDVTKLKLDNWKTGEVWPRKLKHAPFPVFRTGKLENWRSVTTKTDTRPLFSFSNWKTEKLEKLEKCKQRLRGWRDTVWWYWNITKRRLEKAALVREKFPNFCDKTKLPTQYIKYFGVETWEGWCYYSMLSLMFCSVTNIGPYDSL